MNGKIIQNLSRVSLVIMLLLVMATVVNSGSGWVPPSPGTWVYVEPQHNIYDTNTAAVGDKFTISVCVHKVNNLYGYEIHLFYDTEQLDAADPYLPDGHFLTPVDPTKMFIAALETDDAFNATHGRVLVCVLLLSPEPAKKGTGLLFNVEFTIRMEPGMWETLRSVIDLGPTKLGDPDALAIPHDSKDGLFQFSWPPPQVSLWAKAVNVKKRHMDVCTTQTIKGLITNKGEEGAYVRAQFVIVDGPTDTPVDVATSDELWIGPDADVWVTAEWHPEEGEEGSYYVKGVIEFSADGINWLNYGLYKEMLGGLESFRVVGSSWFKVA